MFRLPRQCHGRRFTRRALSMEEPSRDSRAGLGISLVILYALVAALRRHGGAGKRVPSAIASLGGLGSGY